VKDYLLDWPFWTPFVPPLACAVRNTLNSEICRCLFSLLLAMAYLKKVKRKLKIKSV